jgi:S1-C subfamily serine protease
MDDQAHPKEADAFGAFREATPPVPLAIEAPALFDEVPAFLFTHDQGVVAGTVQLCSPVASSLWFHTERPINGGTSGGPVVTRAGRLWGVCSNVGSAEEGKGPSDGSVPRAHLAAPAWLVRRMVTGRVRGKLDTALAPWRLK